MSTRRASIVVRQAITSTIVMLIAITLIAAAACAALISEQRSELLTTIDTEIAGLTDGMAANGIGEVVRRIGDRTALIDPGQASYLLTDARGVRLAGNLSLLPNLDAARSASGDIATEHGPALARATRLRGGFTLVVARALAPATKAVDRLLRVFLLAAAPAALMSVAAGGLVARQFGVRVAQLDDAFARFAKGDHAARSGQDGGTDEVAQLAGKVDLHLAQTQRLIQTQRQISENIAHELRTPLGHLDLRLLRALEQCEEEAICSELQGARADIRSIVLLFDALLDLDLAETINRPADVVFDLSQRLCELSELYEASADAAGLAFTRRITPAVTMPGEPMAMTRAVANLLDNAFKFTDPGDHVRLSLEPGPRIVVEDNGPGIEPAARARIFERFHGSSGTRRGHGLGLALVKVIAVRHGLTAWFEDANPGARFVIAPGTSS